MPHTQASHLHPPHPGLVEVLQPSPPPPPTHEPAWHIFPAGQGQSWAQVEQFSPWLASHIPFPQEAPPPHPPHSVSHSSTHKESHCTWQQKESMPQTHPSHAQPPHPGLLLVVHPAPVPPPEHLPAWQVCPAGHPQSWPQVEQFSPRLASHIPFPQEAPPPQPPHMLLHSSTQIESHCTWQQNESMPHTQPSHAQPPQPGAADAVHPAPVPPPEHLPAWHVCPAGHPQSCAQVEQSSPWLASHIPFPQEPAPPHPPQSSWHSPTQMESQAVLQQ